MNKHDLELENLEVESDILGIYLKKIWTAVHNPLLSQPNQHTKLDFLLEKAMFDLLGISQADAVKVLYESAHCYQTFLSRLAYYGNINELALARLCSYLKQEVQPDEVQQLNTQVKHMDNVLCEDDILHWQTHGFVVVKNAIDQAMCDNVIHAIGEYLQIDIADKRQWYSSEKRSGIMVELIQHEALNQVRRSRRVHKAFSQLWHTEDLIVSSDRCGFNPPQTTNYPFSGPDLHWDVNFAKPLTFGTQGIIYLTDTEQAQGALTLVPGFHKTLPHEVSKYQLQPEPATLHQLGSKPIAANAGDMIIWHHFLPHGSRANLTDKPRIVQYLNMYPFPSEHLECEQQATKREW
ncbi:hypothetical protein PSECIP111854_00533 [Pseudoalteromonas sp. CIP111854]|uniref:Phytanoyl-CoA dioxygenase n=1 Tax=Pseudoalteromonas holothuriae TaxID=2963714 RepID=A0A9W4QRV5_9GAMM|nr:phytanoyl-CoA dioxygenase family protein [Pseudoalteromonas sp. CIP111854]CAH9050450.1 hypothetical protein PSECIP111854_00533 [Pseudoalteromonas sp. CIP111854]